MHNFYLEIGMFKYVVCAHPIQYEFCLIGNAHYVIFHRMG